jgi:ATP-binding cassette subfamily B protein
MGINNTNSSPPEFDVEQDGESKSVTWMKRFHLWHEQSRTIVAGIPRAMDLVWKAHRGYTLTVALMSIVLGIVPTATVWLSKLLIDAVVLAIAKAGTGETTNVVIELVVIQFLLFVGRSLLQTVLDITLHSLQELTARRVQLMLIQHANSLDLASFENPSFYDSMLQAQSQATFRPMQMVQLVFGLIRDLITFFSMIAFISSLGWLVAIAAFLSPIPSFIASSRYGWHGYMLSHQQSPGRRYMAYLLDLLTKDRYNKEIKLFGLGQFFSDKWEGLSNQFYKENRTLIKRRYLTGFALGTLSVVFTSGTYIYVALNTIAGRLTLGDLTFYSQAMMQVQGNLSSILGGLSGMYENSLYLSNLYAVLDYKPSIQDASDAIELKLPLIHGLEFRNVSFTYPGKTEPALRDVSFLIEPDEAVALVGQNGAGKTTIVKLLTRLYDPDAGEILIDGVNIKQYTLESLRAAIGVIFQDYVTYFFSARDNIGVGRLAELENNPMIEIAAVKSGADSVIKRLPNGYETTLGRWFNEGYQLSGGEWQKIALARAFMRDAAILVLDEPTASLDAHAEYQVFARMKKLARSKMTFLISHRFSTVRLANRIFVLEGGHISEAGTHQELLALDGTYAELFNLQAKAYR